MFIEFLLCGRHGAKGWAYRMIRINRVPGASLGFSISSAVKNSPAMQETQEMWLQSLGREDSPRGGNGNPLQYSCLEKSHGQSSLAGYSPWGYKEWGMA